MSDDMDWVEENEMTFDVPCNRCTDVLRIIRHHSCNLVVGGVKLQMLNYKRSMALHFLGIRRVHEVRHRLKAVASEKGAKYIYSPKVVRNGSVHEGNVRYGTDVRQAFRKYLEICPVVALMLKHSTTAVFGNHDEPIGFKIALSMCSALASMSPPQFSAPFFHCEIETEERSSSGSVYGSGFFRDQLLPLLRPLPFADDNKMMICRKLVPVAPEPMDSAVALGENVRMVFAAGASIKGPTVK